MFKKYLELPHYRHNINYDYTINEDLLKDNTISSNFNITDDNVNKFSKITNELLETYTKKNHDYGNSFDESLDKFGLIASIVRLSDKFNRLQTLIKKKAKVKDESIEDTLLDMANYCIMTVKWLRDTHTN